jgi:hypothetical protein
MPYIWGQVRQASTWFARWWRRAARFAPQGTAVRRLGTIVSVDLSEQPGHPVHDPQIGQVIPGSEYEQARQHRQASADPVLLCPH